VRALGVMGEAAHPDDGRFIGKPYGAAEFFIEVDDLMRKSQFGSRRLHQFSWRIFVFLRPEVHG
jgi:hypothetical protein